MSTKSSTTSGHKVLRLKQFFLYDDLVKSDTESEDDPAYVLPIPDPVYEDEDLESKISSSELGMILILYFF